MYTQAAYRYSGIYSATGVLSWSENWMAKSIYELGIQGLIAVVLVWGTILVRGWHASVSCPDQSLRNGARCLLACCVTMLFLSFKATPFDTDPSNVIAGCSQAWRCRSPCLPERRTIKVRQMLAPMSVKPR